MRRANPYVAQYIYPLLYYYQYFEFQRKFASLLSVVATAVLWFGIIVDFYEINFPKTTKTT